MICAQHHIATWQSWTRAFYLQGIASSSLLFSACTAWPHMLASPHLPAACRGEEGGQEQTVCSFPSSSHRHGLALLHFFIPILPGALREGLSLAQFSRRPLYASDSPLLRPPGLTTPPLNCPCLPVTLYPQNTNQVTGVEAQDPNPKSRFLLLL